MVPSHFGTLNTLFLRFFGYILLSVMSFLDCEKRIEVVSFSSSCSSSTAATSSYLPPSSSSLLFFFLLQHFEPGLPNLLAQPCLLRAVTFRFHIWSNSMASHQTGFLHLCLSFLMGLLPPKIL